MQTYYIYYIQMLKKEGIWKYISIARSTPFRGMCVN